MAFIMQSDEDMSSQAVQKKLLEEFNEMMKENKAKLDKYKNFKDIPKLVSSDKLAYKSLSIIIIMLPYLNDSGFQLIE